MKTHTFFLAFFILFLFNSKAQNTIINHELGVFLGSNYMQTDYGEAKKFSSATNNVGFSFAGAYIADFSDSRLSSPVFSFLADHVKERLELSYSAVNFEYDGLPIEPTNAEFINYAAMKGNTKMLNLGLFSEIYIFSIREEKYKLEPYFITGFSYSSISPSLETTQPLPNIFTPTNDNVFLNKQKVFSLTYGVGTRYRLDEVDIVFESRFNSFLSDRVEGLDSNVLGDNNNDSQVIFNLGVVFHLE